MEKCWSSDNSIPPVCDVEAIVEMTSPDTVPRQDGMIQNSDTTSTTSGISDDISRRAQTSQ